MSEPENPDTVTSPPAAKLTVGSAEKCKVTTFEVSEALVAVIAVKVFDDVTVWSWFISAKT